MRVQVLLWSAALAMTLVPLGLMLVASGHSRGFVTMIPGGACQALLHEYEVDNVSGLDWIRSYPVLLVGPAFGLWLWTRWRWIAWVTALLLAVEALTKPAMMAYDVALWGESCRRAWAPSADFMWWPLVWYLVPAVLIAAVVVRRPRWRGWMRGLVGLAVLASLFLAAGDRRPVPVVATSAEECERSPRADPRGRDESWVQYIGRMAPREREREFVCAVRPRERGVLADGDLLRMGRNECASPGRRFWPGALAYLCPQVAAARDPELLVTPRQRDEAFAREEAKRLAYCTKRMSRGDRARTKVVLPGEGGGYFVGAADFDAMSAAIDDRLVGVGRNGIAVSTGEDYLCITVRILKQRPPISEGWDRVVEVGFDNPAKSPAVWAEGPVDFPALGRGSYRVRVHVRQTHAKSFELPRERHLIEVFPGSSKKKVVYR